MTLFRTGDHVRITFEKRTVEAAVVLASRNGKSLALSFEAILGGWAGGMAVLWSDQESRFEDLHGVVVGVELVGSRGKL